MNNENESETTEPMKSEFMGLMAVAVACSATFFIIMPVLMALVVKYWLKTP